MKRLLRRIEAALAAVAFAEEGDSDTARRMMVDAAADPAADARGARADSRSGLPPHAPLVKGSQA